MSASVSDTDTNTDTLFSRGVGATVLTFLVLFSTNTLLYNRIYYYQEGTMVHPRLNVSTAFGKALTTWSSWVDKHINSKKTQVFFRTSAPSHFRFDSDIHSAIVFR